MHTSLSPPARVTQYVYPHLATRTFVVNSMYDSYQVGAILGESCSLAVPGSCNAAAVAAIAAFRATLLGNVTAAVAASGARDGVLAARGDVPLGGLGRHRHRRRYDAGRVYLVARRRRAARRVAPRGRRVRDGRDVCAAGRPARELLRLRVCLPAQSL